jgi:hypothetical protein
VNEILMQQDARKFNRNLFSIFGDNPRGRTDRMDLLVQITDIIKIRSGLYQDYSFIQLGFEGLLNNKDCKFLSLSVWVLRISLEIVWILEF